MKLITLKNGLFNRERDFRERLFNVMAISGTFVSLATTILNLITSTYFGALVSALLGALSGFLVIFTYKTGRYQVGYIVTIIVIFLIGFPLLFLNGGGYHGGMPCFFIFAVLFTVLMIDGAKVLIISALEILEYGFLCFFAYKHPEYIKPFETESDMMADVVMSCLAVCSLLAVVLHLHLREYNTQREELRIQNEKLKRYDESRSVFLSTVSHEIKNPLNAINLHARDTIELMDETPVDFSLMRENQEIIGKMVVRINRILTDLTDTVAIEQGRLSLSLAPVHLDSLISEVSNTYFGKNYTAQNKLLLRLDRNPGPVNADYARITQVVINLLSNAVQHTKNGIITISLVKENGFQLVTVEDNGEGMSEEMKNHALEGYVSSSADYWRHGIGLYVCHQIITAHKGRIWIESEQGQGTKISFTLPEE